MNEPQWEAYDPQMAWEWYEWAVERIDHADKMITEVVDERDTYELRLHRAVDYIELLGDDASPGVVLSILKGDI